MNFRKNYHIATRIRLSKCLEMIKSYNKKYPTPKYLLFIKTMIENGWNVRMYMAGVSKYIFIKKDNNLLKIRFSNHKPYYEKEKDEDCDYYVGVSNMQISTMDEIINKIIK